MPKAKSYWKLKYDKQANTSDSSELQSKLKLLEFENSTLEDKIQEIENNVTVKTFENGKYTDQVRQVCYELFTAFL